MKPLYEESKVIFDTDVIVAALNRIKVVKLLHVHGDKTVTIETFSEVTIRERWVNLLGYINIKDKVMVLLSIKHNYLITHESYCSIEHEVGMFIHDMAKNEKAKLYCVHLARRIGTHGRTELGQNPVELGMIFTLLTDEEYNSY